MILDVIADATRRRVAADKETVPLEKVRELADQAPPGPSFAGALAQPGLSFICEIKKSSPSKGVIVKEFPYLTIAKEYQSAGADAISVLTEPDFFQGADAYLTEIRDAVKLPLLRKDFTVDEYQLYQAKAIGAQAVLLICALLDTATLEGHLSICDVLGLDALVEAHDEEEIRSALSAGAKIIGVNNRNLKTFQVDINNCLRLRELAPPGVLFVAESGINTPADIKLLREAGADAVLIGEAMMKSADKAAFLAKLRGGRP